ncbi:MAG: TetR/AcrR family transcriptional regulator [Gemmatimonadetes bacterium]|nr:TetR/AcrR family transcriptional regulator [Gemmatimonadota bacterium]
MKHVDPKTRLVDVARRLFADQGYEGTSVRDITSRARANLGAITYHFGSKEALYHAVIASCAEPLADKVAQVAVTQAAPLDRIEAVVRTFFDHIANIPEFPRLIQRELASGRPLPPPAQSVIHRNFGVISEAVRLGQQDGTIRPGDPLLLTLSVMAQPFHFAVAGRMILIAAGIDLKDTATRARIVDHVATTVRRALAADHAESHADAADDAPEGKRS